MKELLLSWKQSHFKQLRTALFKGNLCLCRCKHPKFSPLILTPSQEQNGWSKRPGFYKRGGSFNTLFQGRLGSSAGVSPWEEPFMTQILRLNPTF